MSPQPSAIAHYRITSKLGEGGMGAVYRATDTKLQREVAIKVLPPAFAADEARMARFEREAQVLGSLNHPNIAIIYGIEQGAMVMELVDGEEIKGPLPLDTAIDYARQIATGLEAAHERGIVHRDLKPANIKVTREGVVKILDFGLAKAGEDSASLSGVNPTMSPTMSLALTQAGMILGTAGYMAPEQARGKPVDKRSDIWAFGVILFELLTGKPLFHGGETVTDIIAAVVTREPDWSALPGGTPAHLRRLLERCLVKDPKLRLRDIGEARIALDAAPVVAAEVSATRAPRTRLPWAIAILATAVAIAAGVFAWKTARPAPQPLSRFVVDLGPNAVRGGQLTAVPSPDGRLVAFLARGTGGIPHIAIRRLEDKEPAILAGTENADQMFFSPDGQWIGFFADQTLKKISIHGGATVTLVPSLSAPPRGGTWLPDGTIVANLDNQHLFRVPENGGKPESLGEPSAHGERTWRWPQAIDGGRSLIFTGGSGAIGGGYADGNIDILSLQTGKYKTVVQGGYFGRYLPSGHISYMHEATLFAARFDLNRMETTGPAIPMLDDVSATPQSGTGQFALSETGTLFYLTGQGGASQYILNWADPSGRLEGFWNSRSALLSPKISPDGKMIAGSLNDEFQIYDLRRGVDVKLTLAGKGRSCIWAPDSKHLLYSGGGGQSNTLALRWIRADGSSDPIELAVRKAAALRATSLSADGQVLFWEAADHGSQVWVLRLDLRDPEHPRAGAPEVLLNPPGGAVDGVFSPDGRWIAYASPAAGSQIWVRPNPPAPGSGQWQVSTAGGGFPVWSPRHDELFYRAPSGQIFSVKYKAKGNVFEAGKPELWGPVFSSNLASFSSYDVAPDGKRLLLYPSSGSGVQGSDPVRVTVMLNFMDELKRRLP